MDRNRLLWRVGPHTLECESRTLVMGILNVTPDSFSDGGRFFDPEVAVTAGIEMVRDGADILDVGGESTRPGSDPVPVESELDRVVPVIKRLAAEVSVPISIDSRKPEVVRRALEAGAAIVNDVTAGSDPGMFEVVRRADVGMVLMHMRGEPKSMQRLTDYEDVVEDVKAFLRKRVEAAAGAGIEPERLAIDPGLGFAKTTDQSLLLMKEIDALADLGRPVLVGPSRKSFIGDVLGTEVGQRMEGTAGAVAWMAARGAHVVRVHDVKEMVRVVRVVDAIRRAGKGDPSGEGPAR
ncbi:MAG: dihydropteroate synthase [Actinomycetota bacterium]